LTLNFYQIGNDIILWRVAIGLYYNCKQRLTKSSCFVSHPILTMMIFFTWLKNELFKQLHTLNFPFLFPFFKSIFILTNMTCINSNYYHRNNLMSNFLNSHSPIKKANITNDSCNVLFPLLLFLCGDIELNLGPVNDTDHCFSILHQNSRSIRNKMQYIKENFVDFDMLCFTLLRHTFPQI
jgi:hypothetical protein